MNTSQTTKKHEKIIIHRDTFIETAPRASQDAKPDTCPECGYILAVQQGVRDDHRLYEVAYCEGCGYTESN